MLASAIEWWLIEGNRHLTSVCLLFAAFRQLISFHSINYCYHNQTEFSQTLLNSGFLCLFYLVFVNLLSAVIHSALKSPPVHGSTNAFLAWGWIHSNFTIHSVFIKFSFLSGFQTSNFWVWNEKAQIPVMNKAATHYKLVFSFTDSMLVFGCWFALRFDWRQSNSA